MDAWITAYKIPFGKWMKLIVDFVQNWFGDGIELFSKIFKFLIEGFSWVLVQPPASVLIAAFVLFVWWLHRKPGLTLYTLLSLMLITNFGYWDLTMETVSLVGFATLMSVVVGVPVGIAAAHRAHDIALIGQGSAQFRPQRIHPRLIDVVGMHLGQQMRTAPQIQPQIDQPVGHPAGPAINGGLLFGGHKPGLFRRGEGIVMRLDAGIKQVRRGPKQADRHHAQNQDALPERDMHHGEGALGIGSGGLGLADDLRDGGADDADLDALSDLDGDFVILDVGDLADDPALGHHLVATLQFSDHITLFLHALLLRAQDQEIHDHEDQDQRNELGNGASATGASGGLGIGGGDKHRRSFRETGHRTPELRRNLILRRTDSKEAARKPA